MVLEAGRICVEVLGGSVPQGAFSSLEDDFLLTLRHTVKMVWGEGRRGHEGEGKTRREE